MIRSFNGVRLLSSHLIRIYEGVFDRKLNSGILTLSRVIIGHGTVNPNTRRVLSNTSIRGSVSLSRPDYERSNYLGGKPLTPAKGVTEKKFRNGFKDWCKRYRIIFSSEGEKEYMFKWFRDNHRYGRHFYYGGLPTVFEKSSRFIGPLDQEVFYSNELPRDELEEDYLKKRYQGCYICSNRLPDIERGT